MITRSLTIYHNIEYETIICFADVTLYIKEHYLSLSQVSLVNIHNCILLTIENTYLWQ